MDKKIGNYYIHMYSETLLVNDSFTETKALQEAPEVIDKKYIRCPTSYINNLYIVLTKKYNV